LGEKKAGMVEAVLFKVYEISCLQDILAEWTSRQSDIENKGKVEMI
jgi:hypothetical protein